MACRVPCDVGSTHRLPRCQTLLFELLQDHLSFTLSWWLNDQLLCQASLWSQPTLLYTSLLFPLDFSSQPWAGFCPTTLYFIWNISYPIWIFECCFVKHVTVISTPVVRGTTVFESHTTPSLEVYLLLLEPIWVPLEQFSPFFLSCGYTFIIWTLTPPVLL